MDEIGNDPATLFRSISLKPCRDRRPRRSEKKKHLLCVWLHTNSRLKSKICCFPDRRGRRSLQAKNPNRINTPLRSENLIVSGSSKAPVPTGKKSSRIDTPIRSGNSFASRVVEDVDPYRQKIQTASTRRTCVFSPLRVTRKR